MSNLTNQKNVVKLIRCGCKHCDAAKEELNRLADKYEAELKIEKAEDKEGSQKFANWRTPTVIINAKEISHFKIDCKNWEEALKEGVSVEPSKMTGEVVCMKCYMEKSSPGPPRELCAASCIEKGGTVGFLSHDDHHVYLLLADSVNKNAYEALKHFVTNKVCVIGGVYRKGGILAIVVKGLEALPY